VERDDSQYSVDGDAQGLQLSSLAAVLRRRARLIAVVMLVVLGLVAALVFTRQPQYESQARVQFTSPKSLAGMGALGTMPSLLGITFGSSSVETQRLLIIGETSVVGAAESLGIHEPWRDLKRRVKASVVPNSDLIDVTVFDTDPDRAADLANTVASRYIADARDYDQKSSSEAAEYIKGEMARVREQLERSREDVRDYKHEQKVFDVEAQTRSSMDILTRMLADQAETHGALVAAEEVADEYRRRLSEESATYVSASTIGRNPVVTALEQRLAELETEKAGQEAIYTAEHESVKQIEQRIAQVKQELEAAVRTVVESEVTSTNPVYIDLAGRLAAAESDRRAARAREAAEEAMIAKHRGSMSSLPDVEVELGSLQQEASAVAQVYMMLISRYNEMKLNEALTLSNIRVVEPAKAAKEPSKPNKVVNLTLGLILALLLSVLVVGVAEALDHSVRSRAHAESAAGVPCLGTVPRAARTENLALGADGPGASAEALAVGEAFQSLAARLRALTGSEGATALLVASPAAQDGRTTVAGHLAAAAARGGLRTLVIDANLRRPALASAWLGEEAATSRGLADVLAGLEGPSDVTVATDIPNLWLMPPGRASGNPAALLASPAARGAMDALRGEFEIIMVDSPPAALFADSALLAGLCGRVLLVARIHRTPHDGLAEAAARLSEAGAQVVGLVANAAPEARRERYTY